jgi:ATP-dependent RNA helicase DDX3X
MASYGSGDGGGPWTTVPVRSRRAEPLARSPRGGSRGGGGDRVPGVGGLAEAVDGLEIGGVEERRLDKYDIPVEVSGEGAPAPADGFEAAGLAEAVLRNVARCGYDNPTPVQRYAMPIVMAGRDLMACAQTGSGKTAAFCLPVVSGLVAAPAGGGSGYAYGRRDRCSFDCVAKPRALVLAPTRELAAQVKARGAISLALLLRFSPFVWNAVRRILAPSIMRPCADAMLPRGS